MANPPDSLNPREIEFLRFYRGPGSGAHAAEKAGYRGSPSTLKSRASKILAKPGVREWLAERDAQKPLEDLSDEEAERTPTEVLKEIMRDPTALSSSRVRAAELLSRREEAAQPTVDPHAALRAKVNAIILEKRAREREERGIR